MADTYRIETLNDIANIPVDRIDAFIRDLQYAIEMHHLAFGTGSESVPFGPLTWADDGNHSIYMTGTEGEVFLSLEVTEQAAEG
jgi:hypothetical protein